MGNAADFGSVRRKSLSQFESEVDIKNIALWCNGNIDDFGSFVLSSNLSRVSIKTGKVPKLVKGSHC